MKRAMFAWTLRALLICTASVAAAAPPVELHVDVDGVRSDRGRVLVASDDNRWDFPSRWERAVVMVSAPARPGSLSVTLRLPHAGRYALNLPRFHVHLSWRNLGWTEELDEREKAAPAVHAGVRGRGGEAGRRGGHQ